MNIALAADISHGDTRHPVTFRPPGAQSVALPLTLHTFAVRPAKKLRKFPASNQYEKKSKKRAVPEPRTRRGSSIAVTLSARMRSCPSCCRGQQEVNHVSRSGPAVAPAVRLGDRLAYPVARLHRRHGLLHRDPGRNAPGDGPQRLPADLDVLDPHLL